MMSISLNVLFSSRSLLKLRGDPSTLAWALASSVSSILLFYPCPGDDLTSRTSEGALMLRSSMGYIYDLESDVIFNAISSGYEAFVFVIGVCLTLDIY